MVIGRITWKASSLAADETDPLLGLSAAHLAAEQGHVAVLKVRRQNRHVIAQYGTICDMLIYTCYKVLYAL